MSLIEWDHLPLGKVVISNSFRNYVEHHIFSVLLHITFVFPSSHIVCVKSLLKYLVLIFPTMTKRAEGVRKTSDVIVEQTRGQNVCVEVMFVVKSYRFSAFSAKIKV